MGGNDVSHTDVQPSLKETIPTQSRSSPRYEVTSPCHDCISPAHFPLDHQVLELLTDGSVQDRIKVLDSRSSASVKVSDLKSAKSDAKECIKQGPDDYRASLFIKDSIHGAELLTFRSTGLPAECQNLHSTRTIC